METHLDYLSVGIVQTTLDAKIAWPSDSRRPQMSDVADEWAWYEINKALRSFNDNESKPRIIIFPELSIPRSRIHEFERIINAMNVLVVAGIDYKRITRELKVKNQGIFFVPSNFGKSYPSRFCTKINFGKSFPAPAEKLKLHALTPSWEFAGDSNVYIFNCGKLGKVGVSICYDFMDIERALIYRGKIQHLFVLAYNRDINMFKSLAESLSRTAYCNVVVCNTGYYGGSIAISPYRDPHKRIIYAHDGQGLFTTQVVNLPVRELINANIKIFKNRPPGVAEPNSITLSAVEQSI